MRYGWVNQNQTFRHEFDGGYLWSPKRNANGGRNPFYEAMREAAPGDLVFSFADTRIRAFGIVTSNAYENPKPGEFGSVGRNWERVGWRVDVAWQLVPTVVRLLVSPVAHQASLAMMGVPVDREVEVGGFTAGQAKYLEFHRDQVWLASRLGAR